MAEHPPRPDTEAVDVPLPDVSHLVTEDDTPVDNFFSAHQQVLLTSPLNSFWAGHPPGAPFVAVANVGLYYAIDEPALVPDMLLSLGVGLPEDIWQKRSRVYLVWEFGKPPDVVVEVVSNTLGGELAEKMGLYARVGVAYYVVFDPGRQVQTEALGVHRLDRARRRYEHCAPETLPGTGLGLTLWRGVYGGWEDEWLRWTDASGRLIPTGNEARDQAQGLAATETRRADMERQRAERLAARLRELGVDPDSVD